MCYANVRGIKKYGLQAHFLINKKTVSKMYHPCVDKEDAATTR